MKKTLTLLSSIGILLSVTGCSFFNLIGNIYQDEVYSGPILINDYLDCGKDNILLYGREVKVKDIETFKNKFESMKSNIEKMIEEEKVSYMRINSSILEFDNLFMEVASNYKRSSIEEYMHSEEKYKNVRKDYYSLIIDMDSQRNTFFVKIASSKYRSMAFGGYTDEEINAFVESNDPSKNAEKKSLSLEMDEIQNEYEKIGSKTGVVAATYLLKYVKAANKFAKLFGYDNYAEYAYKNIYDREYTTNDSSEIMNYTSKYVTTIARALQQEYNSSISGLTNSELIKYRELGSNFFGPYKTYLDDYAKKVGGTYSLHYNHLWSSGNYYFTNIENESMTAYMDTYYPGGEPYLFFGAGYQSIDTFIHEFGHYNAQFSNTLGSYDLLETQSQGNEVLFANYLVDNSGDISSNIAKSFKLKVLYSLASSVVNCVSVNEVELFAYTHPDISAQELVNYANSIVLLLGANTSYWQYTAIFSPCYYISYATSAYSALSLNAIYNNEGFDKAKDVYLKAVNYPSNCSSYIDVINYSGLSNAFDEKSYEKINVK